MQLNTTDAVNEEMKLYEKIEHANQELIRVKKVYADLEWEIGEKKRNEQKKTDYISQTVEQHQKVNQ